MGLRVVSSSKYIKQELKYDVEKVGLRVVSSSKYIKPKNKICNLFKIKVSYY